METLFSVGDCFIHNFEFIKYIIFIEFFTPETHALKPFLKFNLIFFFQVGPFLTTVQYVKVYFNDFEWN